MRYLLLPLLLSACALSPLYGSEADAAPVQMRLHRASVACDRDGAGKVDVGQSVVIAQGEACKDGQCRTFTVIIEDGMLVFPGCGAIEEAGESVFATWIDGPVDEG
jgi:hypothetical protein